MAYVFTGYKRSLSVSITKKINNIVQSGYPKTYPTATDISNGYFTYDGNNYDIPDECELAKLDTNAYNYLLAALKAYAESLESGLDFNTDTVVAPVISDESTCPPGTPGDCDTTTTTTTLGGPTTTTTTPWPIQINVVNSSVDTVITAVSIGGSPISVLAGSFPLATGATLLATMSDSLIGSAVSIVVQYTNTLGDQSILMDLASPNCYNVEAGTPATSTRDIVATDIINIAVISGACMTTTTTAEPATTTTTIETVTTTSTEIVTTTTTSA